MMDLDVFDKSDVGQKRKLNEDSLRVNKDLGFFIISDGMGGPSAGEVASQTFVDIMYAHLENALPYISDFSAENMKKLIQDGVNKATKNIFNIASMDLSKKGMGCTGVVLIIRDNKFFIGWVGDSRMYIVHPNQIMEQITWDHSVVWELYKSGQITREEMDTHPKKNLITRAIGIKESVIISFQSGPLLLNDRIILCSDGLTSEVHDNEILSIISNAPTIRHAVEKLILTANNNGGKDNTTVILVESLLVPAHKESPTLLLNKKTIKFNTVLASIAVVLVIGLGIIIYLCLKDMLKSSELKVQLKGSKESIVTPTSNENEKENDDHPKKVKSLSKPQAVKGKAKESTSLPEDESLKTKKNKQKKE